MGAEIVRREPRGPVHRVSAAQQRAERIRDRLAGAAGEYATAVLEGDWDVLGYDDVAAWAADQFGQHQFTPEARRQVAGLLSARGKTTRQIAAATGVNQATSARDLTGKSGNESRPRVMRYASVPTEEVENNLPVSEPEPEPDDPNGSVPTEEAGKEDDVRTAEKPPAPVPDSVTDATIKPPAVPGPEPVQCPGCRSKDELIADLEARVKALAEANKRLSARPSAGSGGPERVTPVTAPQTGEQAAGGGPCAHCKAPGARPLLIVMPDGAEDTAYACDGCLAEARRRQPEVRFTRPEPVTSQAELDEIYGSFKMDLETA